MISDKTEFDSRPLFPPPFSADPFFRPMLRAARRQGVNINRLSFADTLAWLRHGDPHASVELIINPLRPGRLEPRVRKRPKKQFPYMTVPRSALKSQLRARYRNTT
jgi:hypothetical protein